MSCPLYMDVHVHIAVTRGLRRRNVDVLTAQEDQTERLDDSSLLDCATELGRVLVSQDEDFHREAGLRQQAGVPFSGLVYAHQRRISIGQLVRDLELLAKAYNPADMLNRVEYLPL